MMKTVKGIWLVFLLLTSCQKEISDMQADYFIKFYGSYMEDDGYDVQPTADGGFVIVGSSERANTGRDIVLIRVDKFGNQLPWSPRYFGGNGDDAANAVRILDDGGFIIAGYVTDTTGKTGKNATLIRTGADGSLIWQQTYGGPADDEARSVVAKKTGGYIFAGYTESLSSRKQIYLVNTDDNGNAVSTTTRPVIGEELTTITELSDGNFLVAGKRETATDLSGNSDTQILIIVLNDVGNALDNYVFGDPEMNESVSATYPSADGTFYLVGTLSTPDGRKQQAMIKKLARRKVLWENTIPDAGLLDGKAVCELDDGSLALVANKSLNTTTHIELYHLNSQGEVISSREFGASEQQTAEALTYLNGHLVIVGKNASLSDGYSMITLIKTDKEGNLWK